MSEWETAQDSVLVVDSDWRVVYANQQARRLLTGSCDSPGDQFWAAFADFLGSGTERMLREAMVFGRPDRIRHRRTGSDALEVSTCKVFDNLAIFLRVSEEADAECLTTGPDRIRDFLATMNHEIRTPLNGILGHAEMLLADRSLTPQQRRYAHRIQSSGSALLVVANELLNYALAGSREAGIEPAVIDVRDVVQQATFIARQQAELKGLVFECMVDPALPHKVIGDKDRIAQILLNLLGNAVKFTSEGRVRLSVGLVETSTQTAALRFAVADTGIGIPIETQSRLFELTRGPDPEIRQQFGGAALGLPVVKQLVEAMGGSVGLESVVGLGSTVWFVLSLPLAPPGSLAASGQFEAPMTMPARILLVEDNEINQEIARSILESAGHEVDVATDGSQAVLAVQSHVYQVVLMDVQMPIMDGVSATKVIRSLPGPECDVPIIALTANVLPDQVRSFKQAGMNDHLGKPFQRDQLLAVVNRWAGDNINLMINSLNGLTSRRCA